MDLNEVSATSKAAAQYSVTAEAKAAVPYAYENVAPPPAPPKDEDAESQPVTLQLPPGFALPEDMAHPHTQKQFDVLERTACFLAHQDAQMEILLRAKQANNPWMWFLRPDHRLHPLFLHIKLLTQSGKYVAPQQRQAAASTAAVDKQTSDAAAGQPPSSKGEADKPKKTLAALVSYSSDDEEKEEEEDEVTVQKQETKQEAETKKEGQDAQDAQDETQKAETAAAQPTTSADQAYGGSQSDGHSLAGENSAASKTTVVGNAGPSVLQPGEHPQVAVDGAQDLIKVSSDAATVHAATAVELADATAAETRTAMDTTGDAELTQDVPVHPTEETREPQGQPGLASAASPSTTQQPSVSEQPLAKKEKLDAGPLSESDRLRTPRGSGTVAAALQAAETAFLQNQPPATAATAAPIVVESAAKSSAQVPSASVPKPIFIVPPPDIKAIVDKTAAYVARNPPVSIDNCSIRGILWRQRELC